MAIKTISGTHTSIVVLQNYPGYLSFDFNGSVNVAGNLGVYGDTSQAWTVTNSGLIAGTTGIFFQAGGSAGTVDNLGTIVANATNGTAILLESGGSVDNRGLIQSPLNAVWLQGGSGTVTNSGTIGGTAGNGVVLKGGGTVDNTGTIAGTGGDGVYLTAGLVTNGSAGAATALIIGYSGIVTGTTAGRGTVVNYGTITATGTNATAVLLRSGGSVGNYGVITGPADGILVTGGGGTITNGGTIRGASFNGIVLKAGGTVTNTGTILGSTGDGLYLTIGTVTNGSTAATAALISGYTALVGAKSAGTVGVVNDGTIASTGSNQAGVFLGSGGGIDNHGVITGPADGIFVIGGSGTITNSSTIRGAAFNGIVLQAGGSIDNQGIVAGGAAGIYLGGGSGTVNNSGTISATGTNSTGIDLETGGSIGNSGLIDGVENGVFIRGTAAATVTNTGTIGGVYGINIAASDTAANTIVNSGTISGSNRYAIIFGNGNNLLVIDPRAVFTGNVYAGTGSSTIELRAGAGSGILGLGTQFNKFDALTVDTGAVWRVGETGARPLTVSNGGTIIVANDGLLAMASDSSGATGTIQLAHGSTLDAEGPVGAGQTVDFTDAADTLILDQPASFAGTIAGFQAGDELDLVNTPATTLSYSGTVSAGTLSVLDGSSTVATLRLAGGANYNQSAFALTEAGGGVSRITLTGGANSGLLFTPVYDASVASAPAGFIADLLQGLYFLEQQFVDPITINLEVGWGEIEGSTLPPNVDEGRPLGGTTYSYSEVKTTLTNDATSSDDFTSVANLPGSDPTSGGLFYIGGAEQKALGLIAGGAAGLDGAVGFQGDPTLNLFGSVAHEVTHALGRIAILGTNGVFSVLDLLRYTSSGLSPTAISGAFFSIDGGKTVINTFSDGSGLPPDAIDYADWTAGPGDAFNNGGGGATVSPGDITEMNVLGYDIPCFCRGTLILTERGEMAVEDLAVGDRVRTLSGAWKPIVWIGVGRELVTRRNSLARPIIVQAGALADRVPHRDLYLTHGHALYLDGVLIPVENLVNHRSIRWDESARVVEYYHIELEDHAVLFADGAPAESYYDAGNRASFQTARPGSIAGEAKPTFAPVLNGGDIVDAAWAKLLARSGGQIETETETIDDPDLHLVSGRDRIEPICVEGCRYRFSLEAPPAGALRLSSRSGVPSLMGLTRHDHRRLGVALKRVVLGYPGVSTSLDHDSPLFSAGGCHPAESGYAWTDGAFELPARLFAHLAGPFELTVEIERPGMRYPLDTACRAAA